MGNLLDKPNTDYLEAEEGEGNGIKYGVSSMQGWRTEMEDAHTITPEIPGLTDHALYAVFDGHGGQYAARYASEHLVDELKIAPSYIAYVDGGNADPALLGQALQEAFLNLDSNLRDETRAMQNERSGCTAIATVISPSHIVVANAGDSRSAMQVGSETVALSEDHKPYNAEEKNRIEAAGGCVSMKRVDGELAVSRALGDFQFKDANLDAKDTKVTAFPDITIVQRSEADEFVILACDGIWDVMTNEQATKQMTSYCEQGEASPRLMCEEMMCDCLERSSRDNMSVVTLIFPAGEALTKAGEGVMGLRKVREEAEKAKAEAAKNDS
uniref:PPM-type phosphatase domain-containing protein n=1 Tax=Florenciella parvula TaxID=236787 RepID=A0A7S2B8Y2_9STRA|mmetsp:Transcript_14030/g.29543  ORF Transcript_14030/g.29543 Transcript_14030/m.29543 type:complete len:327 (+) Transcript_14030:133-1113(+)|eukprot:CAMPEP_0182538466 /NCGR_PEP_ID=MMETSP1323-20130603/23728_1 /TAXON_ID=236787 /ORGANISM="Florenciella parvula, Strain RCC1693" /LENGTH=326 /DNA_ID=CAMNT_0024748931 /DNA_START=121 /DNA_END=1101 /DNA_ORIENTATION=-